MTMKFLKYLAIAPVILILTNFVWAEEVDITEVNRKVIKINEPLTVKYFLDVKLFPKRYITCTAEYANRVAIDWTLNGIITDGDERSFPINFKANYFLNVNAKLVDQVGVINFRNEYEKSDVVISCSYKNLA
jgi:hypothetical protein